jgi:hypothetical protein
MGRPKTINVVLAEVSAEHVGRIRQKLRDDPAFVLTEGHAKVLKTLAETQLIIQRRKPEGTDGEEESTGPAMTIEELERLKAEELKAPPAAGGEADDS